MKKVVISGSASLNEKAEFWKKYWEGAGYEVIDYPKQIPKENLIELYEGVHRDFLKHITQTDILFLMNEDKNSINGYIGAGSFSELCFGIAQNTIYNKHIEIYILKMPDQKVQSYDEINIWLKLGKIKLFTQNE